MNSYTVEYQRFGSVTGILSPERKYLRTEGTHNQAEEVSFPVLQQNLSKAMGSLNYNLFKKYDASIVRKNAKANLTNLEVKIRDFLPLPKSSADLYQLEVVTQSLELAQLPFEILEESDSKIIVTRRIRQPWHGPKVNRDSDPKVLFVWAEPRTSPTSSKRITVPHAKHLDLFKEILRDWGGASIGSESEDSPALDVVKNATLEKLANKLKPGHPYTHVHLLAHGVGPLNNKDNLLAPINLDEIPEPTTFLALENNDGSIYRCPPGVLAKLFAPNVPRPTSFVVAMCRGGTVKPIEPGGTFAHVLHASGIPIVLASQLPLTKNGSGKLIKPFYVQILDGEDPRIALRKCRDSLRLEKKKTYYDRVAVVGYIHLEKDFEESLPDAKFKIALARLKAASRDAAIHAKKLLDAKESKEDGTSHLDLEKRFVSIRERLKKISEKELSKDQVEELWGLQASSLKREADWAWQLAVILDGKKEKESWGKRSREALREALEAYSRAAKKSRDHHWSWVQKLVLEAVVNGNFVEHQRDWEIAKVAAEDVIRRESDKGLSKKEVLEIQKDVIWAYGSMAELYLLSTLFDFIDTNDAQEEAQKCLKELVERFKIVSKKKNFDPIGSTLSQLHKYVTWWGKDEYWNLPTKTVNLAEELHTYLESLSS